MKDFLNRIRLNRGIGIEFCFTGLQPIWVRIGTEYTTKYDNSPDHKYKYAVTGHLFQEVTRMNSGFRAAYEEAGILAPRASWNILPEFSETAIEIFRSLSWENYKDVLTDKTLFSVDCSDAAIISRLSVEERATWRRGLCTNVSFCLEGLNNVYIPIASIYEPQRYNWRNPPKWEMGWYIDKSAMFVFAEDELRWKIWRSFHAAGLLASKEIGNANPKEGTGNFFTDRMIELLYRAKEIAEKQTALRQQSNDH